MRHIRQLVLGFAQNKIGRPHNGIVFPTIFLQYLYKDPRFIINLNKFYYEKIDGKYQSTDLKRFFSWYCEKITEYFFACTWSIFVRVFPKT